MNKYNIKKFGTISEDSNGELVLDGFEIVCEDNNIDINSLIEALKCHLDRYKEIESIAFDYIPESTCLQCGASGLHACTGQPVLWSKSDKDRLDDAIKSITYMD